MAGTSSSTALAASTTAAGPPPAAYIPARRAEAVACSRSSAGSGARRHRKAVGFTNCRNTDDPHVDIEVVHHLPDQDQLLVVLSPKRRGPAARSAAASAQPSAPREVRWARITFEFGSAVRGGRWCAARPGTWPTRWGERHLDTPHRATGRGRRPGFAGRRRDPPGAELKRIDEDRHHDHRPRNPFGRTHQGQMPVVQGTHGGHQHHPATGMAQRASDFCHPCGVG